VFIIISMNQEVAKLWLYGANLGTTISQIGIRNSTNTEYTFFVDLRLVLGESMFQKYEAFKVYFGFFNPAAGSVANFNTMFVNGINLIQASYQGKQAGFNTAVDFFSQTQSLTDSINFGGKNANIQEFVMIKPDNAKVELTISFLRDDAGIPTLSQAVFFLTFAPFQKDKIYKNPFNYLYQNELANFTLTTQILSAGATNAFGTMNSTFTTFTFTNVNMRRIIGTMWDKYDKFNLVCLNVGVGSTATTISSNQRFMFFQIQGLQFINCLSTTTTSSFSQSVAYTPIFRYISASTSDSDTFAVPESLISFRKPESENVDLAFQLFSINNGGTALNLQMNQFSLTFAVVGIKE
jgi:hypothetical protein